MLLKGRRSERFQICSQGTRRSGNLAKTRASAASFPKILKCFRKLDEPLFVDKISLLSVMYDGGPKSNAFFVYLCCFNEHHKTNHSSKLSFISEGHIATSQRIYFLLQQLCSTFK